MLLNIQSLGYSHSVLKRESGRNSIHENLETILIAVFSSRVQITEAKQTETGLPGCSPMRGLLPSPGDHLLVYYV